MSLYPYQRLLLQGILGIYGPFSPVSYLFSLALIHGQSVPQNNPTALRYLLVVSSSESLQHENVCDSRGTCPRGHQRYGLPFKNVRDAVERGTKARSNSLYCRPREEGQREACWHTTCPRLRSLRAIRLEHWGQCFCRFPSRGPSFVLTVDRLLQALLTYVVHAPA